MKDNLPRKLLITSLVIVFLSSLFGLVGNLLTGNPEFNELLKKYNIGWGTFAVGVIVSGTALLMFSYLQFQYARQIEQKNEIEDIELDVKEFHKSLKESYQKRYDSKLDERFEITLEISEDWNGKKTQSFKERYDIDAKISEAFPRIKELFDKKDGLLIVGEPGAGKTVLLLKVAINLLKNTNLSTKEAFPVIFNLASWSEEYADFGEWLKSILVSGNRLSEDFASHLILEKRLILLLDGLDELARNNPENKANKKRAACLEALNKYLDGEKSIICCRIDEFVEMRKNAAQDAPVSAKVEILNLIEAELLNVLEHARNHNDTKYHASAKNLIRLLIRNAMLRRILCTPFYFTIALEIFYKHIPEEVTLPNDKKKLKTFLIERFVTKKLDITPNPNDFNERKTKTWLKWLAKTMERKQSVLFELADLQPSDLDKRWHYDLILGSVMGLVGGLFFGLFFGLFGDPVMGLMGGLSGGLIVGLVFGFEQSKIITEDIVELGFSRQFLKVSLGCGLVGGLFMGLVSILVTDLIGGLIIGMYFGLLFGLIIGFFVSFFDGFSDLKKIKAISNLYTPYQRIFGGFSFALLLTPGLFVILGSFIFSAIIFFSGQSGMGLGYLFLISIGSISPIIVIPLFKHSYLRLCLWYEGSTPLKYATFLDYATEARILEKDGGFWRFRHQNLQDYFANLKD
jgi:hypothetical protein